MIEDHGILTLPQIFDDPMCRGVASPIETRAPNWPARSLPLDKLRPGFLAKDARSGAPGVSQRVKLLSEGGVSGLPADSQKLETPWPTRNRLPIHALIRMKSW